jgi:uncharacterized protein YeaO (DUF488 family)
VRRPLGACIEIKRRTHVVGWALIDQVQSRGVSSDAADFATGVKDAAQDSDLRYWSGHDPARLTEFSRHDRA